MRLKSYPYAGPSRKKACKFRHKIRQNKTFCTFVPMIGKVHIDPVLGEVTLRKSIRSRRISIRVHPGRGILVTVPFHVPYAMGIAFLESRREWARAALERSTARNADLPEGETIESLRAAAKAYLPDRLRSLATKYGFRFNRVTIKHNTSNWGSCSSKGNINLNLNAGVASPAGLYPPARTHASPASRPWPLLPCGTGTPSRGPFRGQCRRK